MEKDVIISIRGVQDYVGEDGDDITLVTEGKLEVQDGTLHLKYEESALTGMEGTTTEFFVEPERVTLLRTGALQSQMIFEQGKRHLSLYYTPYGSMEIGVRARKIRSSLNAAGGTLEIDYDVEMNHMMAGSSLFHIDVREAGCLSS